MDNYRRVLVTLWFFFAAAVTVLSLLPASVVPHLLGGGTLEHFSAYLALALIPVVAIRRVYSVFVAVIAVACLGVLLEILQLAIPGRASEWADIAMNSVGMAAGVLAGLSLRLGCNRRMSRGCSDA
ncbi:MAG: VanZ family protein [Acidobacteria bacterium]|nr:VanZ family protein [Acidobacteriota bacterium]